MAHGNIILLRSVCDFLVEATGFGLSSYFKCFFPLKKYLNYILAVLASLGPRQPALVSLSIYGTLTVLTYRAKDDSLMGRAPRSPVPALLQLLPSLRCLRAPERPLLSTFLLVLIQVTWRNPSSKKTRRNDPEAVNLPTQHLYINWYPK